MKRVKMRLMPELQSAGSEIFNIGLEPQDLMEKYEVHKDVIDFGGVHVGWNDKTTPGGRYQTENGKVDERVKEVLKGLWELQDGMQGKDGHVVVVSHSSILNMLLRYSKFDLRTDYSNNWADVKVDDCDWRGPSWKTCVFPAGRFLVDVDSDALSCIRYLFLDEHCWVDLSH